MSGMSVKSVGLGRSQNGLKFYATAGGNMIETTLVLLLGATIGMLALWVFVTVLEWIQKDIDNR